MTETAVPVRLPARMAHGAVPEPSRQHPGRGSSVTVVAILPKDSFRRKGYAIDEWGQFHEVFLDELIFEVPS